MKKLFLLFILLSPKAFGQSGPVVSTGTISTTGQSFTVNVPIGASNHSVTFSVASGSPSGIFVAAKCSKDGGASYPLIFGTSTSSSGTLKVSDSCTQVQTTINYSGTASFSITYLGAPQNLNNVVSQSGIPGPGQIAYFLAPGVLAASSTTIDSLATTANCAGFNGSDAAAKIAACIAALPATGGVADATGITGAQTFGSDFFSGVTKVGTLILGAATYTASVPISIPSNWTIKGIDSDATIVKASGALAQVFNGANATGVTISDLKIDGNSTALVGINLNNSVIGTSTVNRVTRSRVYNTTTTGVSMDNNGDSTIEDTVFSAAGGVSIHWNDIGGNINLTRVTAINANDRTQLAFQTAAIVDSSLRGLEIIDTSQQLRLFGGYLYGFNSGAVLKVDSTKVLGQIDGIGTRFEITDALQTTGLCAIDGKFGTGLFLTGSRFGNAADLASKNVFCANFGSASALLANLWMYGGTVATDVTHSPTFNPSGVITQCLNFVTAAGTLCAYGSYGFVGNDGSTTLLTTANVSSHIAEVVRGTTSQTADIQEWQDVGGNPLGGVDFAGNLYGKSFRGVPATYANRPTVPLEGMQFVVTDSTVTSGNVTGGGGSHHNLVIYNGTNWVVVFNLT